VDLNYLSQTVPHLMKFKDLTAVITKMAIFWAVVPCILVDGYLLYQIVRHHIFMYRVEFFTKLNEIATSTVYSSLVLQVPT
jgi:hypothetical protein